MDTSQHNGKRILVFSQHFWPEVFRINDICKGLVEQGFSVDVICGLPNYPIGKIVKGWGFFKCIKEEWEGVRIRRIWEIPRGKGKNLFRILLNFVSWPFFCLFYLPFIGKGYDKVLMYQLTPVIMAFPAILYAKATKTPLFIKILDYWPFSVFAIMGTKSRLMKKIITALSQWHYKKADGLIASFEGIQRMLISDVGIPPEKTIYIPQACGKYHEHNIYDKELDTKYSKHFCIVFTGCINPAQCFDILIPAAKKCYEAGYKDIHWVIVGDGMSRKDVEEMVHHAGLTDVFHFEGFLPVEEMPKYYTIADAFVACLRKSILGDFGVPAKIIPYFAAGKPVIGALDGDAAELITSTRTGYCGPANDTDALYGNICKMYLSSKQERDEMGKRAKEYYFKHFEHDTQLQRLIDFMYTCNDHTFVILAYKESKYLEECIESLKNQTQKSKIIISTSTPNAHIEGLSIKYGIELRINQNDPSISGDWNFAYNQADTRLITLAHQDDIYLPDYLETALKSIKKAKNPIIFFSHYAEIREGTIIYKSKLLRIKKLMLKPIKMFKKSRFIRRRVLSFGSPICCPSVMYIDLKNLEFSEDFKCNLDWRQWEKLSKRKGSFVYAEKPLMLHRIHEEAETTKLIKAGIRKKEDIRMFNMFWPPKIAKILARFYSISEDSNKTLEIPESKE